MQSEPSAATPNTIPESAPDHTTPSQHGRPANEPPVSLSPADNVGAGETAASGEQLALDAALAASLQESADQPRLRGRLSPARRTPSPPAFNRITEYEKASTPPVRRREGPEFEVIKKPRSPGDKRSPIQELPNGE